MACLNRLPYPHLEQQTVNGISFLTDDALASSVGVYAGFTLRHGGVSKPPYHSLNLATHVNDDACAVQRNRQLLLAALGFPRVPLLVPNQVHGTNIVTVESIQHDAWTSCVQQAESGADAIIVSACNAAALLCFADCLPAIIVSPTGRFAVVHAGWRGALAGIVSDTVAHMRKQDLMAGAKTDAGGYNLYLGPHICASCFEVSAEIAQQFSEAYGSAVLLDERHVSLEKAVCESAVRVGIEPQRIAFANMCTVCNNDQVFSYRASGGVCGRHAAFGIRRNQL